MTTLVGRRRPVVRVRPSSGWRALNVAEVWRYRELVYILAWRDVKVRYKQTALGVAWAILQPLAAMAVFTLFLGRVVQVPTDGVPYPLFTFVGLLPWTYFANAVSNSSNSLVSNTTLVSKVYFPRLVLPVAGTLSGLVDLGFGLLLLIGLLAFYRVTPSYGVALVPLLVLLAIVTAVAVGVWLSAINVHYRDVPYAIPLLLQVWMFATPIVYPVDVVPEDFRALYGLNPMVGVVEGFRWVLLPQSPPPGPLLILSIVTVLVVLVSGLFYFRRMERSFGDLI